MSALKMIHIAKRDLRLDDDTYRAMALRITGKSSSKDMDESERQALLAEFRRKGFKPALKGPRKGRKPLAGPYAKKLQALWISAWNLGLVIDRQDGALLAFVERQTGIERTEFLRDAKDARKAVEALKAWLERDGGVDWNAGGPDVLDGARIARAQWLKLHPEGTATFWAEVSRILGRSIVSVKPDAAEWVKVMNALGKRIRDTRGARRAAA